MNRRSFLVSSGVGGGALALMGRTAMAAPALPATPVPVFRPGSWEAVRAEFDRLTPERIHMAGFFFVSHPRTVREAIEQHRDALDRDPFNYIETNTGTFERAVRTAASSYMGTHPDELAMTDSTSQGLGLIYGGIDLRAGQEILSTTHDHRATGLAVDYRATNNGSKVRRIALYDDPASASADEITNRLAKAIKPETRVVALTWVHSGTGVKLPLRAIGEVVARANAKRTDADRALLVIDGVHGFANQDVDYTKLGCDFFITGCHKWLFGPRGTGLVWGRPEAWPHVKASIPTMDAFWRKEPPDHLPAAAYLTPGGFHSFEHRWALSAAFEMHQRIGKAAVATRIRDLNTRCKQGLAKIRKVRVKTPMSPDLSSGIICFEVDGLTPKQVVDRLAMKKIVASVTPPFYTPAYARLAPSLLTLEADVDRTVAEVAAL
jgi:selenocysteine lyase/cysteine desulfurase